MQAYISDKAGNSYLIPSFLSWEFNHSDGELCDSFELTFIYKAEMYDYLKSAIRLSAVHENERVFTGIVDEFSVNSSDSGLIATLTGRGYAAILMDNEAEAAEYYSVNLSYIISEHVSPFADFEILTKEMNKADSFQVYSGDSQWSVLTEFCTFCGDVTPRFDRCGRLILDGTMGDTYKIDGSVALTSISLEDKKYGRISEVIVKNYGSEVTVYNEDFLALGGSARRIVNLPKSTTYDTMRYTGSWQIAEAEKDAEIIEIEIPAPFLAFACDYIELEIPSIGVYGTFYVRESSSYGGSDGYYTKLKLGRV